MGTTPKKIYLPPHRVVGDISLTAVGMPPTVGIRFVSRTRYALVSNVKLNHFFAFERRDTQALMAFALLAGFYHFFNRHFCCSSLLCHQMLLGNIVRCTEFHIDF